MPQPNGPAIRKRREELGILRRELAATVGISYQHLYNIECGFKAVSIERLYRISKALGLPIGGVVIEPDDERRPA